MGEPDDETDEHAHTFTPSGTLARNPFGLAGNPGTATATSRALGASGDGAPSRRFAALQAQVELNRQLWSASNSGPPDLGPYGPAAVRWFRWRAGQVMLGPLGDLVDQLAEVYPGEPLDSLFEQAAPTLDIYEELLDSATFLVDPGTTFDLLAAPPPGLDVLEDLRLPHRRQLVLCGAPFVLGPDSGWWDPALATGYVREVMSLAGTKDEPAQEAVLPPTLAIHTDGCVLYGVLLRADDGHVQDEIEWLVAQRTSPSSPFLLQGSLALAEMRPLVDNLAAAAAWGRWTAPDDLDDPAGELGALDGPARRRAMNKGAFRRRMSRSKHGVHTLRPRDTDDGPRTTGDGTARRSPAAHTRRGYWRAQRYARRDHMGQVVGDVHGAHGKDWTYRAVFIAPTFVGSGPSPSDARRVYVVPSPAPPDEQHPG